MPTGFPKTLVSGVFDLGGSACARANPAVAPAYAVGHNLDCRDARGRRL